MAEIVDLRKENEELRKDVAELKKDLQAQRELTTKIDKWISDNFGGYEAKKKLENLSATPKPVTSASEPPKKSETSVRSAIEEQKRLFEGEKRKEEEKKKEEERIKVEQQRKKEDDERRKKREEEVRKAEEQRKKEKEEEEKKRKEALTIPKVELRKSDSKPPQKPETSSATSEPKKPETTATAVALKKDRSIGAIPAAAAAVPAKGKCVVCSKTAYVMDQLIADGIMYHKSCFRCSHCNNVLKLGNYAALDGKLYCKPHFKQLFASKGNYNEGFGKKKLTHLWAEGKGEGDQPTQTSPRSPRSTEAPVEEFAKPAASAVKAEPIEEPKVESFSEVTVEADTSVEQDGADLIEVEAKVVTPSSEKLFDTDLFGKLEEARDRAKSDKTATLLAGGKSSLFDATDDEDALFAK